MADRMFLDEICPTLQQKLQQKLIDEPGAVLDEQDFQDFEMGYQLSSQDNTVFLKVNYPFLASMLEDGSKALLNRVWQGAPIRGFASRQMDDMEASLPASGLQVQPQAASLLIALDAGAIADSDAERQRCMQLLAMTRTWLLIGPLVERLRWLRDVAAASGAAAAKAAPGNQAAAATAAAGTPPPPIELQLRKSETVWIIAKTDRVIVITSVHFEDEVDVTLARTFCQEFADSKSKSAHFAPPCTFNTAKDLPTELREVKIPMMPNVGFLTLTIPDEAVKGVSDDRLHALARPVMTLRNFFHFHLKHAKSYLHSRLRRRIDGWHSQMNGARIAKKSGRGDRRLATGKVFNPQARTATAK